MSDIIEVDVDGVQLYPVEVTTDTEIEMTVTEQIIEGGGGANLQTKSVSYTPTESAQSDSVNPDVGYDGMSKVNVSVGAIPDDYVGTAVPRRASSSLSASGATVTAPAGYYSNQASKSVQSGTEGTPSASKGAVSNHSVEVTPSVTNTEGYISGGTKTGTPVSVSASELVSGTKSITSNGESDVTNYQKVNVAVPAGSPTLQNKTVHPSSSDQSITADVGYDGLGTVTAKAVTTTNLTAANIVSGVTVEVGDADDSDRILSVTGTASGGGGNEYKTGSFTPASRAANVTFDCGLADPNFVLIVPHNESPLKSAGKAFTGGYLSKSAYYKSFLGTSNNSGASQLTPATSAGTRYATMNGTNITVYATATTPVNVTAGYFETIQYDWYAW